jgi:hypothetical protein
MTFRSESQTTRRTHPAPQSDATPDIADATDGNPLTLTADISLDAETIRAALSVLPTAVADGEQ